jgi:hypothetical protein
MADTNSQFSSEDDVFAAYDAFRAGKQPASEVDSAQTPQSEDEVFSAYDTFKANKQAAPEPKESSPFTDTLKSTGAHILSSVAGQPVEDVGKLTGLEGVEKAGRGVREFAEEVQRDHPSSIQSLGDIVERPWDAVKEAAGNVLPQIPVSLAGASAGAKLGASLPLPPQGKAAAAGIGGLAGIFAPSWLQEYTEMRGKQRESGQEDMGKAALTAIPAAGLETVTDVAVLGKLIPEPVRKSAVGKLVDTLAGDTLTKTGIPARAAHAGKQLLKGAGIEGGQEYAQTYLEQVGGNQDTSTPEAQAEREVSAALGAIGGGGIRGGISAFDQVQAPQQGQEQQPPAAETQAPNISPEAPNISPEAPNIVGSETPSVAPNVSPEIIPETAPETEQPAPEAEPVSPVDPVTEQLNETLDSAPVKGVANAAAKAAVKQNLTPEQQQAATGVPPTVEEEAAKTPEPVVTEEPQTPVEAEPTPTYRNFPTETLLNAKASTKNPKVRAAIKEELQRRRQEKTATPEEAPSAQPIESATQLYGDDSALTGSGEEDRNANVGGQGVPEGGQTLGDIQPEASETPLSQTVNLDEQSPNQTPEERPQETTGQIAPNISPIDAAAQQTEDNKSFVPESLIQEGEYRKADTEFQGIPIAIENAAGSERRGTDKTGREWKQVLADNYGEIHGTNGADGDKVDVFIKPGMSPEEIAKANKVFIVDQIDPETGLFDEHKILFGRKSVTEARKAYLNNYENGWKGLGAITGIPIEKFKAEFLTNPEAMRTPYNKKVKVAPQQQAQAALEVKPPTDFEDFEARAKVVADLIKAGKPKDAYFTALKTKVPLYFAKNEDGTVSIKEGGFLTSAFRREENRGERANRERLEALFRQQQGIAKRKTALDRIREEQAPKTEPPQASAQTANLESLFNGLDPLLSDAKTRMETKAQIAVNPASDRIKYVEDNFVDWLFELEQSGKVKIKC